MADRHVGFERQGDVGVIVVDSPPLNLWTPELHADLEGALDEAESENVRALVLRAEGRAFTGGVDVQHFQGKTPDEADEIFQALVRVVRRLEDLPLPTLASVHALCLTWGLEVSLGCDLIFAAESARFGLVEKVVGLTPAGGGTQCGCARPGFSVARNHEAAHSVQRGGSTHAGSCNRRPNESPRPRTRCNGNGRQPFADRTQRTERGDCT